ncbi:glucokinase [Desulfogranum mediterraneum]|uniref:glucokinase n=1 Tax=Desulfogranum mediterraneum TaxID=160661 RepID=UPI00040F9D6E|nr:glucokinase [Desulfogranum mediterraneum]
MINPSLLLAADIGGTKTTLALYHRAQWPGPPLAEQTMANHGTAGLEQLIAQFLDPLAERPAYGCFGVAGPVRNQEVEMTNLSWRISAAALEQRFGFQQLHLLNDLMATAMGTSSLQADELVTINPGSPVAGGTVAVLAPGTGLGEAFLTQGAQPTPHPSEGGHASFAPRTREQIELLCFMLQSRDHVSVEQVCSGSGLPQLFAFLRTTMGVPPALAEALAASRDQTPLIVASALKALQEGEQEHIAVRTLELFTAILADEAANLALKTLSLGGLFLGGGLPPRILPFFESCRFMSIFARGVYRDWLRTIPIQLILNPKTAIAGAAAYGFSRIVPTP